MSRFGAASILLAVGGLVALALGLHRPPSPRSADAAPHEFSAERAFDHVDALAVAPRPPGSEAHDRAERYLVAELEALGLEPEVQEGWVVSRRGAGAVAVRVRNVLARRVGTGAQSEAGSSVVLLSHYDSVPTGPGAGDDAAGVAATLETLRALGERPLRNDILAVITDGEEGGLNGARLFVDEHPAAAQVGVVLNMEARGNRGVVQMFQTSPGSAPLVRTLAAAAPHPFASSLAGEVYRRMPNDTDLTVFLEAGKRGMNFALIGGHSAYHTELDTPARLSLASLQHLGSNALALTERFGSMDLGELDGGDAIYFNPLGGRPLVVYSIPLARAVAALAALLLFAGLYRGLSSNRLDGASVRGGTWAWLLLLVAGAVVSTVLWIAVEEAFPAVLDAPHGDPYASDRLLLGLVLACLGAAGLVSVVFSGCRVRGLAAGVAVPWVLGAVALSIWLPGASYLLAWPALAAAVAVLTVPAIKDTRLRALLIALAPALAALLFAPTVALAVAALQVNASLVVGLSVALPMTLLVPALSALVGERTALPVAALLAGIALFGWTAASAAPSALTPAPTSLFYAYDADEERAYWLSHDRAVNGWTEQVLPPNSRPIPAPDFLPTGADAKRLVADAPAVYLPGPEAELVEDAVFEGNIRRLSLRVRSARGAPFLLVAPDPSLAALRAIGLPGKLVEVDAGRGPVVLAVENLPPEGVVLMLETFDRQPVDLSLLDWSFGLPRFDDLEVGPRPAHLLRSTRWLSDSLLVHASHWF